MADDVKNQIKLGQQLAMTPQLQMAIRLLSTPSGDLHVMLDDLHGLEPATGHVDPLLQASDEERALADKLAKKWHYHPDRIKTLMNEALAGRLSLRMPMDPAKCRKIVKFMRKAAMVDGILADQEKELLDSLENEYCK